MDMNWFLIDLLAEDAMRERRTMAATHLLIQEATRERSGLRRTLASRLVRLGLRLDPAAGEGLGALRLSGAGPQRSASQ